MSKPLPKDDVAEANRKFADNYGKFKQAWKSQFEKAKQRELENFKRDVLDEIWERSEEDLRLRHGKKVKLIYIDMDKYEEIRDANIDSEMEQIEDIEQSGDSSRKVAYAPESLGLLLRGERLDERLSDNIGFEKLATDSPFGNMDELRDELFEHLREDKQKAYETKEKVLSPYGKEFLQKKIEKAKEYLDQSTNKYPFITDQFTKCSENGKTPEDQRQCMDMLARESMWEGLEGHPPGFGKLPRSKDINI